MTSSFVQFFDIPVESLLNTQTHLLVAAALLCQPTAVPHKSALKTGYRSASNGFVNMAVLFGAVLPDISLFFMFAQAKVRGISDNVIWGEMYYSPFWQEVGAISNSIPIYAGMVILGLLLGGRIQTAQHGLIMSAQVGRAMLFLGLAALLHCVTDLPLHVDDGHAHFWPLSDWIFASPVSYWDSDHYASYWQPVELLIGLVCFVVIWRRFSSIWVRIAAFAAILSYGVIMLFWSLSMG